MCGGGGTFPLVAVLNGGHVEKEVVQAPGKVLWVCKALPAPGRVFGYALG